MTLSFGVFARTCAKRQTVGRKFKERSSKIENSKLENGIITENKTETENKKRSGKKPKNKTYKKFSRLLSRADKLKIKNSDANL